MVIEGRNAHENDWKWSIMDTENNDLDFIKYFEISIRGCKDNASTVRTCVKNLSCLCQNRYALLG